MAAPMSRAMRGRFTNVQRSLSQIMTLYDRNIYRPCRISTIYLTTSRRTHDYASARDEKKKDVDTSDKESSDFFGILEQEENLHDDQSIPLKKSSKFDYLVKKRNKRPGNVLDTEFGHVRYDKNIPDCKKSVGSRISSISKNDVIKMEGEKAGKEKQDSQRSKKSKKAKDFGADQHEEKNSAGKPDRGLNTLHIKDKVLPVIRVPVMLQEESKAQVEDFQVTSEVINSQCITELNDNDDILTHSLKSVPKVDYHVHESKVVKDKTVFRQPCAEKVSSENNSDNYFDEQYFQYDGHYSKKLQDNQKENATVAIDESTLHSSTKQVSSEKDNHKLNYFDEQYFNYEGQYLSKLEDSQDSMSRKPQSVSESRFQSFTEDFRISSSNTLKAESEYFPSKKHEDNTIEDQYFQRQSLHISVEHKHDQAISDSKNENLAENNGKSTTLKSELDGTMVRDTEEIPFEEVYFPRQRPQKNDERTSDGRHITPYVHPGDNTEVNKSWKNNTAKSSSPRSEKKEKLQMKTGKEVKTLAEDKKIADSAEKTEKKERKIKKQQKEDKELKSMVEDKKLNSNVTKEERKDTEQGREAKHTEEDKLELKVFEKERKDKSQKKEMKDSKSTENDTISAHDVAMEIRNKLQKNTQLNPSAKDMYTLDSKGFRILKGQVRDLNNMPSSDVVELLWRSIIYNENDIVAINKPYGLPSHGGPGVEISVGQLLPSLAEKLDRKLETLHLIHRLDKEATGVMLLARTPEMAWRINGAFRHREVVKKYWAITKFVPKPTEGIINIPMAEGTVQGKTRMVLRPDYGEQRELLKLKKNYQPKYEAVTKYRVRDSNGNAALVECIPETGIKHQIRVHLAFGLNTPILGDHKYSHFDKLAPQKLPTDILHRLKVQQSKVRYVPMHLHAVSVMIPEFLDGQNFYVSATLPMHFVRNLSSLKLKINP